MGVPSQPLPTIGQPNSTEDAKVRSALGEMQTILSGNVDATNLAAKAVTSAKLFPTAAIATSTVGVDTFVDYDTTVLTHAFTTTVATRQLVAAYAVVSMEGNDDLAFCSCGMTMFADGVALAGSPTVSINATLTGSASSTNSVNRFDTHTIAGVWLPTMTAGNKTLRISLGGGVTNPIGRVTVPVGRVTLVRLELAA